MVIWLVGLAVRSTNSSTPTRHFSNTMPCHTHHTTKSSSQHGDLTGDMYILAFLPRSLVKFDKKYIKIFYNSPRLFITSLASVSCGDCRWQCGSSDGGGSILYFATLATVDVVSVTFYYNCSILSLYNGQPTGIILVI